MYFLLIVNSRTFDPFLFLIAILLFILYDKLQLKVLSLFALPNKIIVVIKITVDRENLKKL